MWWNMCMLLSLIDPNSIWDEKNYSGFDVHNRFRYDFSNLDKILDQLMAVKLYPVIEFMGNPSNRFFNQKHFSQAYLWKDLVYQMISRYIREYFLVSLIKKNLRPIIFTVFWLVSSSEECFAKVTPYSVMRELHKE